MTDKRKYTLHLAGKDVSLVTAEEPAYMQQLEAFINRRLSETAIAARTTPAGAANLCLVTITDELLKAQEQNTRLRRRLRALQEAEAQEEGAQD